MIPQYTLGLNNQLFDNSYRPVYNTVSKFLFIYLIRWYYKFLSIEEIVLCFIWYSV